MLFLKDFSFYGANEFYEALNARVVTEQEQ